MLGRVPLARVNDGLHFFALLVAHFERPALRRLHFDLQLAIRAIQFRIGGVIADGVLVANVGGYLLKNSRQLAFKARENKRVLPSVWQRC